MPSLQENPRNIVFFGEIGVGKSSAINLLLETGTFAPVSNDAGPCTRAGASYETTLNGVKYMLWDTRGLGEGRNLFRTLFRVATSSENELKKFLRERHQSCEIDLLVYCVRGSRATKASAKYYNDFCAVTRQLAAPVVILVTQLEREATNMEEWWNRNSSGLEKLKMEFDGHACITTLPGHSRITESRETLIDLITQKRQWQAQGSGPYFGSSLRPSVHPAPPPRGGGGLIRSLFKGDARNHGSSSNLGPSSLAGSTRSSSYYTAESPRSSMPSSPVVEPPTPCSATAEPAQILPINTHLLGVNKASQPSEGGSSSPDSQNSLFTVPHSSTTSHTDMPPHSCTDTEDHSMNHLPFRYSPASIVRKKSYATRYGAFGDIWECDLISEKSSHIMVAVKAVKLAVGQDDLRSHEKKLHRELRIWGRLQHRNIVPLLGIVDDFGPLPSMVSPWFRNGSLSRYLDRHLSPSEKRILLGDIAAGLSYLHSNDVIHGDIHSDNVLVDDDGRACLTDFGLSLITEFVGTSYLKSSMCGAVQFADPALVQQVHKSKNHVFYPTKPCDVYSFGGLLLHVLSKKKPYDGLSSTDVFLKVLMGERPSIPTHVALPESLIQRCWDRDELKRPLADDLRYLLDGCDIS